MNQDRSDAATVSAGIGADLPAGVIARIWHGATRADMAAAYLRLMRTVALPDYRIAGSLGAFTLLRHEGDTAHFLMLTFWESEEAIAAFAGKRIEAARYYDFDADFLLEEEPTASHYQVYSR
jgi:heme-degrading monooxygenase HmoA